MPQLREKKATTARNHTISCLDNNIHQQLIEGGNPHKTSHSKQMSPKYNSVT